MPLSFKEIANRLFLKNVLQPRDEWRTLTLTGKSSSLYDIVSYLIPDELLVHGEAHLTGPTYSYHDRVKYLCHNPLWAGRENSEIGM